MYKIVTNVNFPFFLHILCSLEVFDSSLLFPERDYRYTKWKMAVQRSLGWALPKKSIAMTEERYKLLASIPGSLYVMASFGLVVLSEYLAPDKTKLL